MRNSGITLLATMLIAACATVSESAPPGESASSPTPSEAVMARAARADSVRQYYTRADVAFMTGMIHHHAQALVMARMAPSHGASAAVRTLTARILNGQRDEIVLMQRWLRDRGEAVPVVHDDGTVELPSTDAPLERMAGMLTPEQMARLRGAHGRDWDRLFLTYMIQHHQGALVMVDELFSAPGAGQGDEIFKIASSIGTDQATEIDRMQRMLRDMVFGDGG